MWKNIGKWALKIALWAYGHRSEIVAAIDELKKEDQAKVTEAQAKVDEKA